MFSPLVLQAYDAILAEMQGQNAGSQDSIKALMEEGQDSEESYQPRQRLLSNPSLAGNMPTKATCNGFLAGRQRRESS